uniref:Uncharacterized protein n=1 Tax=Myoviridae sp. ctjhW4 TaxID=2825162 RepID=A0A8S5PS89_9CAUD|nr:MAG TPA: hypothetical protein [Myoviridae sp. ctjhW4]
MKKLLRNYANSLLHLCLLLLRNRKQQTINLAL